MAPFVAPAACSGGYGGTTSSEKTRQRAAMKGIFSVTRVISGLRTLAGPQGAGSDDIGSCGDERYGDTVTTLCSASASLPPSRG